jgi:copper homeostasis protein
MYKLEIIGFNLESCMTAQLYGAHRVELCANPAEGGTTPSSGFIKAAREKLNIELYVMIRPRGGDFCYSTEELDIMKQDIKTCKELGCDGVVLGILNRDGTINKPASASLASLAYPMGVTFHRAFDHAANPFQALEDIIESGFERILTSGQLPSAEEGADFINQLIRHAEERIIIMPGSGVRAATIGRIAARTGAHEFHSSATAKKKSVMQYFNPSMKEDTGYIIADEKEVSGMISALNQFFRSTHEV